MHEMYNCVVIMRLMDSLVFNVSHFTILEFK